MGLKNMLTKTQLEELLRAAEKASQKKPLDINRAVLVPNIILLVQTVLAMQEALERIKDGGVPLGVQANVVDRMLEMNNIATNYLEKWGIR